MIHSEEGNNRAQSPQNIQDEQAVPFPPVQPVAPPAQPAAPSPAQPAAPPKQKKNVPPQKKEEGVQPHRPTSLRQLPVDVQNAFQTLRTNVQFAGIDNEIRSIVITSALPDEGKSTLALNFAISMAEAGKNTLIVDTDCRRPMIGNRLKVHPQYTWLDVLARNMPVQMAVTPISNNLFFLDAEPQLPHTVELIASNRFSKMIEDLRNSFDVVIFDTPPIGSFIEGAILSAKVDGVILVISAKKVHIAKEKEVIAQLEKVNAKLIGAVLNGVKTSRHSQYYYYYYNRRGGKRTRRVRHKE